MPRKAEEKPQALDFGPGEWFVAGYDGECDGCGAPIEANYDEIRRVETGYQGRECCGREDEVSADATQG